MSYFLTIKRAWSFIWQRNKVDVIRSILNIFLRERPLFLFFFVVSVRFFSWQTPFIIFILFVFCHLLNESISLLSIIKIRLLIIKGAVAIYKSTLPDLKIKKYQLSDYLNKECYDDINEYFVSKLLGLVGVSNINLNKLIQLYSIDFNATNKVSGNPTCYSAALFGSYIFLGYPPGEDTPHQRFILLHEIGHAALGIMTFNFFENHGLKVQLFSLALAYWLSPWQFDNYVYWLILLIVILIGIVEQRNASLEKKLFDEIRADQFSLGYLDYQDILYIKKHERLLMSIVDSELTERQNTTRIDTLKILLKHRVNNEEDEFDSIMKSTNFKPSFLIIFFTGVVFTLPAFFTDPPTDYLLLILLATTLFMGISLFVLINWQMTLNTYISKELARYNS